MSTKKKSTKRERSEYKNIDDTLEEDEDFELELDAKRIRSSHKFKELDTRDILHGARDRKKFASNSHYSSHGCI